MGKSKKIEVKNAILKDQDGVFKIESFEGEEIPFENLTEEMKEIAKLGSPLNIKISKARKNGGAGAGRKPTHKFVCPKCSKKIKTTEEKLVAKCMECNCEFVEE